MKEIVALHDAGRAVSSVIDLDQVSRKIVDAVARTFDVQLAALWLVEGKTLRASAARARRRDVSSNLATEEASMTMDKRLVELETRYSHLERLVDDLSKVVFEQGKSMDVMRAELVRVRAQLTHPQDGPPQDETPPHY